MSFRKAAAALLLFGISFGYVEAAVVAYLRTIYDPVRARLHPEVPPGELFPLIKMEELKAEGPRLTRLLPIEVFREAATMLMLAAAGLAVAHNARQWIAAFAVAFGVWDASFYVFLKVLINWPASLFTWDILFLIPVPWDGPVLAPVLVSFSMIVCGLMLLRVEAGGSPFRTTAAHWLTMIAGGLIIIVSFAWDAPVLIAGGMPQPFRWPVFALGEAAGLAAFVHAWRRSVTSSSH